MRYERRVSELVEKPKLEKEMLAKKVKKQLSAAKEAETQR